MPLEIVFKLQPKSSTTYAVIGQTGYGRIDETSPTDGLATFGASSCTVIVSHCAKLKRTTLNSFTELQTSNKHWNRYLIGQWLKATINTTIAILSKLLSCVDIYAETE